MKKLACVSTLFAGIAHAQSNQLIVSNLQVVPEANGISAITGRATNRSGQQMATAFVRFNLLDNSGALVGNTVAMASILAPGHAWKFSAETPVKFTTVKLSGVDVYPVPH